MFRLRLLNRHLFLSSQSSAPFARMRLGLYFLILVLVEFTAGGPNIPEAPNNRVDDVNIFLTVAWQVASHMNPNSSCYVCGLMPYTAGEGLPLMALPPSDCDTCHLMHVPLSKTYSHPDCTRMSKMRPLNCSGGHSNCNRCVQTPKPVPIFVSPHPFPWCLQNDGEVSVGRSECVRTFRSDASLSSAVFHPLNPAPQDCVETTGEARLNALAQHSAVCSISSPSGMYWVCGNLAYPYLPVDYNGRCGLAYVIPAMRVAHSLPRKAPRKRARRGTLDTFGTHHQSRFKNVLGTLLPFYGIMSSLDQIADLSHAIEIIANETSRALSLISSELASVRLLALQNRAALDFLLAAQGGTCAVIGSECCTFVPDYNTTINEIVSHLRETGQSVHQDSSSVSDWLGSMLKSLSSPMLTLIVVLIAVVILLSLLLSCVKKFLCSC